MPASPKGSAMDDPVPVLFFAGLFIFLTLTAYFRYKLRMSALEKGLALPETPKGDVRKAAIVLIALGLGYAISMYITLSNVNEPDAPAMAVSIWGIVPILIGAGLWRYRQITEKERQLEDRSTLPLT
jgi:hypothetical protein